ncbi:BRCA1-associated protein [Vitis vinifera]|uniref:BRCA1-associated protein n=1 Tax=Vitis vinifera TaxID=29760 RepID=A0A438DEW4_VITVI|nr:BRCA1-associated protein [Vitis vinifera]
MSNFRPISLITSLYKIIAKVLSRHLRGVLHETIHSTQGSFVQGRQILDAVLIANEIVDEKRQSGEEGVVFKIDFEKAYDHGKEICWSASGWVGTELGLKVNLDKRNPKACGFWDPVIERISRRLDGWQKAYLSFGVRITLIQSCLTHMPCYFLSLFKIPVSVAAKIERGIGIGKISLRNLALLRKWLWRYLREGSALWHQGILSIYGSHSNTIVRWSHRCPWKAIAQVFQEFSKFTQFVVCRYCQQQSEKSVCIVCQTSENLWICVLCGFVGCGRYKEGHAIRHWKETQHCYSLELETQRVWDYVGDNYVHRLIQSKTDGKLVELNAHCAHADHGCGSCDCSDDAGISEALLNSRVEAIVNEYSDLLTTQLENQKLYFESLLREVKEETEREISEAVEKAVTLKLQKLQAKLDKCVKEKKFLDDLNENLLQNQEIWEAKIKEIEERERKVLKLKDDKIQELEEQERQEQLPAINEIKDEPKMVEQLHLQTSNEAPSWQYQESRLQEVA